ncbi:MAG: IS630 family transposase [Myxococcota bacterium]|nr:IS630 family transposase [Myxococcota bacterium]
MPARHVIELTDNERETLCALTRSGTTKARRYTRARVLLLADEGWSCKAIEEATGASSSTVYRTRSRFVDGGLEHALSDARRPGGLRKLSVADEAILVATACSQPPEGQARWTLQLLADRLVTLSDHDSISIETIRRRLKEVDLKPWQKRSWCLAELTPEFIAQMESVLQIYSRPPDPRRPLVSFDETLKQLVEHVVDPIPAKPGKPEKVDHHYKRNGTAHVAVALAPHQGWRKVWVLENRKYQAFAHMMRELVDVHFPEAEVVQVVMDNLNTHSPAAFYRAFPPAEARRVLNRLQFHYTPKKGSWLNMVEIEIGVLVRQCLNRRIGDRTVLAREIAAWEHTRNEAGATVRWMFNVEMAREKFARHYPDLSELPPCPIIRAD